MKVLNFRRLFLIMSILIVGCGDSGSSGSTAESSSCKAPRNGHSGCCSSHGGWANRCGGGQAAYGDSSGRLVCDDGTFSPSCVYSTKPVEEMMFEYEEKFFPIEEK